MECKGFTREPPDFQIAVVETPRQLHLDKNKKHLSSGRFLDKMILWYSILKYSFIKIA